MRLLLSILCKIGDRLLPKSTALWLHYRFDLLYGEAELSWVKRLCVAEESFVDVGSAEGVYAFAARGQVRDLCLFEPNPVPRAALQQTFPSAHLFDCALSSERGEIELRTPVVQGVAYHGFTTIEGKNKLDLEGKQQEQCLRIQRCLLDDLLPDQKIPGRVCLMKVDVEGHELPVLQGAENLLDRDQPALIVESERRHNPAMPLALFEFLQDRGYQGFYLDHEKMHRLSDFGPDLQPDPPALSKVRNFIFAKRPEQVSLLAAAVP